MTRILDSRNFMLVEKSSANVYNYEGRLICSPRWPSMQPEILNESCISLSPGVIAVRDQNDDKGKRTALFGEPKVTRIKARFASKNTQLIFFF